MDEDRTSSSAEVEDERWQARRQRRDWLLLGAMIAVVLAYHLVIFALEPGLR